jgi:CheY-like chemotaxis protein
MATEGNAIPPVLIAEDQNDNLVMISLAVQDFGYRVITAKDGEEAVQVAVLSRPQLILLDIAMPKMDGLEAARRIRKDPGFQNVPIVALTAFSTDGFRRAAGEAGFDGYLTKPVDFERLRRLMNTLLSGRRETDPDLEAHTGGSRDTGEQNPRFLLWRMFCAENNISIDAIPSGLDSAMRTKWEEVKRNPKNFFKF